MKNIKSLIFGTATLALAAAVCVPAAAQSLLPADFAPVIVAPAQQNVSSAERTICYDLVANVPFETSTEANWVKVRKGSGNTVYLHLQENYTASDRTADIVFKNEEKGLNQVLKIAQTAINITNDVPTDVSVTPTGVTDNALSQSESEGSSKTIDGDVNTMYHSAYNPYVEITEANYVQLTYSFTNVDSLDYIEYVPRQSGSNGNFKEFELWVRCVGDEKLTKYGSYDFEGKSAISRIVFDEPLRNPRTIEFRVFSGNSVETAKPSMVSCAEMRFMQKRNAAAMSQIFTDDLCTELQPGVTREQIMALPYAYARSLALQLLDGTYDKDYRVAEYPCILSYVTLSDMFNAPGKYYDQMQGVTGINISKGKHLIFVDGMPEVDGNFSLALKVVAWYAGEVKEVTKDDGSKDWVGVGPREYNFSLTNGLNIINYPDDFDGLAYICYYANENPEQYENVKVHFANGEVNGYLSPEKDNRDMYNMCANAANTCMDVVGKKVHSIWTSEGLARYCKARDGVDFGYRQYMNILDSLVHWEHRLLGLEKYDRIPKNKTMAYVNYTYYMFQGGYGVSFKYDTESRVLNCKTLMERDDDAIWGLSHEWGHQHQMHPYSTWAGQAEVTNNLMSYYNITHMGYFTGNGSGDLVSAKDDEWPAARKNIFENYDYSSGTKVSDARKHMYMAVSGNTSGYKAENEQDRNQFVTFCNSIKSRLTASDDFKDLCLSMEDGKIGASSDLTTGVSQIELGAAKGLCPYIMLQNYFYNAGNYPDFTADLFESLRLTDEEKGSNIEKGKTDVDKYELIASAQNSNKNDKLAVLREKYPESCWVTKSYINRENCYWTFNSVPAILNYIRKCSWLTGYDLTPYFEKWGYIRVAAMAVNDYGWKAYIMTQAMYDEFKADMKALVDNGTLKPMTDEMVRTISYSAPDYHVRPNIPN